MLPADGVPLAASAADSVATSTLASQSCGTTRHCPIWLTCRLDPGRSTTAAVPAAMALALALKSEMPADAKSARVICETFGVAPDPLSSTVLSLALVAPASHALATLSDVEWVEPWRGFGVVVEC